MRLRTAFFDGALFTRALRRWWPLGLALCAALMYQCLDAMQNVGSGLEDRVYALLIRALQTPLPALFALAAAMLALWYLHSARASAFMAALPVHRGAAFLSQGAAALAILLAGEALCALLTPFLSGAPGAMLPAMGQWFAVTALLTAAYFGIACLCAVLTGSAPIVPALYALFLYAAVALESTVRTVAQFLLFGIGSQRWKLTALSPVYYLKNCSYELIEYRAVSTDPYTGIPSAWEAVFVGWGKLLGYLAAGALCLALALWLLQKRRAEAAGDVIAVRALRGVFRSGAALAGGCALAMLLLRTVYGYDGTTPGNAGGPKVLLLIFALLLGIFIGWFGAEMLLRKTLRVFDRHWRGFGVWAALALFAVIGCELDLFGVERAVPAADKIGTVTVSCWEVGVYDTTFKEPENIAAVRELHRTVTENKALFEQDGSARYATGEAGYGYDYNPCGTLILQYYDRDGALLMTREYTAPNGAMAWASSGDGWYTGGRENPALPQLEALVNTSEALAQRCLPTQTMEYRPEAMSWVSVYYNFRDEWGYYDSQELMTLSGYDAWAFCTQAALPDLADSSLGWMRLQPQAEPALYNTGRVQISLGLESGDYYWYWYGNLTPDARHIIAWLSERGVDIDPTTGEYTGAPLTQSMG